MIEKKKKKKKKKERKNEREEELVGQGRKCNMERGDWDEPGEWKGVKGQYKPSRECPVSVPTGILIENVLCGPLPLMVLDWAGHGLHWLEQGSALWFA